MRLNIQDLEEDIGIGAAVDIDGHPPQYSQVCISHSGLSPRLPRPHTLFEGFFSLQDAPVLYSVSPQFASLSAVSYLSHISDNTRSSDAFLVATVSRRLITPSLFRFTSVNLHEMITPTSCHILTLGLLLVQVARVVSVDPTDLPSCASSCASTAAVAVGCTL
jgi:hypothetical protein